MGKCIGQYRYATFHLTVMNVKAASGIGVAFGISEELGKRFLVLFQNARTKATAFANMQVGFRKVVDAHQDERRP